MSQTLTISAPLAMAAVPGLIVLGGVVVGIALNGWLTTGIEVARLNAANDDRTARWLWLRGYRSTPHAGPELTSEVAADDAVTGELLAVDGVDTEADAPHEDDHHSDAPAWQVWLAAVAAVFIVAVLLPVWLVWLAGEWAWGKACAAGRYVHERWLMSDAVRDAEFRQWCEVPTNPVAELEGPAEVPTALEPPTNPTYKSHRCPHGTVSDRDLGYRSRHTAAGYETGIFPAINATIPAQRTGDEA